MKKRSQINAPSAPKSTGTEVNPDATPAGVLYDLVEMVSASGNNPDAQIAALELKFVFTLDPSVEHDLCRALGCQDMDVTTMAGKQAMFDKLNQADVLKIEDVPSVPGRAFIRLNAGMLLNLLREMPHREGGMGLSLSLVQKCNLN